MGLFSSINIAQSGLNANQVQIDVIANNIANANTTRTTEGGAFRRSRTILRPRVNQPYWRSPFLPKKLDNGLGQGVRVEKIEIDRQSDPILKWDPHHPDAHSVGRLKGYVELPNVSIVAEMVDMINVQRHYEANTAIIEGSKTMFNKALSILA